MYVIHNNGYAQSQCNCTPPVWPKLTGFPPTCISPFLTQFKANSVLRCSWRGASAWWEKQSSIHVFINVLLFSKYYLIMQCRFHTVAIKRATVHFIVVFKQNNCHTIYFYNQSGKDFFWFRLSNFIPKNIQFKSTWWACAKDIYCSFP